jgi:hypothetical protein
LPDKPDASALPPPGTEDATVDSDPGQQTAGATITAEYDTAPLPNVLIAGRYTLEKKIGEGGMGEVWVANQSEPVKRKVALKLIKPGTDSRAVIRRFEQERQALALMDHPNIAKVLDAGLTHGRSTLLRHGAGQRLAALQVLRRSQAHASGAP